VIKQLDQVFVEIDVKPRQVSIEAMILSVRLSDNLTMGVNFEALRDKNNVRLVSGSPLADLANLDVSDGGLKFGFLDASLAVFIDALETVGDTNVIASPRLMCLNKQRAEIQIGEQLGYVSTTVTENSATQSVNFLDVGTLLRLRPNIGNDGMIRLEVHPELSTGSVAVEQGLTLPNKSVTQVTTNVMCADGCTVIIGGLIRQDLQNSTSQIPFLGSLPLVGPAFRQKVEDHDRTEIIVLLTPRIVSEPMLGEEGRKYGDSFTDHQSVYFDKMSPAGKRSLGLFHLRKARAAYAAGDYVTALHQVNTAIHFDTQSREATDLRREIIAAGGFDDESINAYLHQGLTPLARQKHDYSREGYPWKVEEGFPAEPPMGFLDDVGEPGPIRTIDGRQPSEAHGEQSQRRVPAMHRAARTRPRATRC
jgi:type IV pilus assembly protein PilQ